ncbi:MAG: hypothetical protein KF767_17730 [Bdellovibrionaceae bacterium]|nr:hypothetical protein [Pseudobdellovibrionaceae bacterium]
MKTLKFMIVWILFSLSITVWAGPGVGGGGGGDSPGGSGSNSVHRGSSTASVIAP